MGGSCVKLLAGFFAAGLVLGVAGMWYWGGKQYGALKTYADSTKTADSIKVAQVTHFSDSVEQEVTKLQATKQKVLVKFAHDTIQADVAESLLAKALTASDSVRDLSNEVLQLKNIKLDLMSALALADSVIQAEKHRADSLQNTLDAVNNSVKLLTEKINKLHGTPTWLKVGTEIVKVGLAGYAGFKLGQSHP
jgi:hypothetical protein